MKFRLLACSLAVVSAGCRSLGAVVVVPSDSRDEASEAAVREDVSIDRAAPSVDVIEDARAALDASAVFDAALDVGTDAGADVGLDANSVDASMADSGADSTCVAINPATTGLASRGVAVSADRTAIGSRVRVYYVGAAGTLRMEWRDAALRRDCSVDLGAPHGVTLVGTPAAAHRREHVFVAARNGGGDLEYWGRFSTNLRAMCGTSMSPWEKLPDPPAGERLVTAPFAFTHAGFAPDPVLVVGQTASGAVYEVHRTSDADGPTAPWSVPQLLAPSQRCRTHRARPLVEPKGPDRTRILSLEQSGRGGNFWSMWEVMNVTGATTAIAHDYFGTALPTTPVAARFWLSTLDFGYVQAYGVGAQLFAWAAGFQRRGASVAYDPMSLGAPSTASGAVQSVAVANGFGTADWQGEDGDLYVIAQYANDPSVLHFAVARADEWFDGSLPVVWQRSADRLE